MGCSVQSAHGGMPPPGASSRARCVTLGVHRCVILGVLLQLRRPGAARRALGPRSLRHAAARGGSSRFDVRSAAHSLLQSRVVARAPDPGHDGAAQPPWASAAGGGAGPRCRRCGLCCVGGAGAGSGIVLRRSPAHRRVGSFHAGHRGRDGTAEHPGVYTPRHQPIERAGGVE